MELNELTARWKHETGKLPWGVQKAFKDALTLVREGKARIVYGADYKNGSPCLVNATAQMLGAIDGEGGHGKPMENYGDAISLYDKINRQLFDAGINTEQKIVSPEAAYYLLSNFGPDQKVDDVVPNLYEAHFSDGELARQWLDALSQECDSSLAELLASEPTPATD